MGNRTASETGKGRIGLLVISIAANLAVFAYLFDGLVPNAAFCGVIGGIAGGLLFMRIERVPSPPSRGGEFLPPPVSERQTYRRSA